MSVPAVFNAQPSSISSSSSLTVSISFWSFLTFFGDTSLAAASIWADLTSSPINRYARASWKITFDSSGDESRRYSRSFTAAYQSTEKERGKKVSGPFRRSSYVELHHAHLISLHRDKHFRSPITHKCVFRR